MNELPDELWASEVYRTRVTSNLSANDADEETLDSPYTTEESVLLVALGVSLIAFSSAVMALLAATVGLSLTLTLRKLRAITSGRGKTNGVSQS